MDKTVQLLDQMLTTAHPQMVESLYLAAIPSWFTPTLFSALRRRDDGRDEGILERFDRYSFVERFASESGAPIFSLRAEERDQLQRRWIAADPDAYRAAHARALDYWQTHPDPNPFAQAQNRLYHLLFVDQAAGTDGLIGHFRAYHNERHLTAIKRLLDTADRAYTYLRLLDAGTDLDELADLLAHLRARLAQLHGHWTESLAGLQALWHKPTLPQRLRPYVARAYGQALAHTGDQSGAMDYYRQALALFEQQLNSSSTTADPTPQATIQAERAHTLLALGDAYAELAATARGGQQEEAAVSLGIIHPIRAIFYAFISLPLLLYLSFGLGRQVWRPRFWPQLRYLDWIIARLFAEAASYYSQADPLLEQYGQPAEAVIADEKLAFLYLAVGDPHEAERLFRYLLAETEAPLGPYRRALAQVGLGESLLRLGQRTAAETALQTAVPTLQAYEDRVSLAGATLLLAQASATPATAVAQAQQALQLYQELGREEEATNAAEHLARLETAVAQPADKTALFPQRYSYPVRYRHPATVILQRLTLVLLTLFAFIIPVSTIRLETGTAIVPQITFTASPLLQPDMPDFTPQLSQGVAAIRLTPVPNPEVVVWLGLLLFAAYLFISTGLGLLAIMRTSAAQVQAAREERTVRLNRQQIQVGTDSLALAQVTQLTRADVRIWHDVLSDHSQVALGDGSRYLIVQATTHWYEALAKRLERFVPATARQLDLSYRMLNSKLGVWYLVTLLLLLLVALIGLSAPPWTMARPWGQPYSLFDLYPYFYLGLVLPPLWWFVLRPLQIHSHILPQSAWPWGFGLAGLLLAMLRLATGFRPWFTTPDIYPPLLIIVLLLGAAAALWQRPRWAFWQRAAVALAAGLLLLPHLTQLGLDVTAYHYLATGHAYRDRTVTDEAEPIMPDQTVLEHDLRRAAAAYTRAYELATTSVWGINRVAASENLWGIPPRDRITWLAALNSRAAVYSQLGEFEYAAYDLAIEDYLRLTRHLTEPARVFASMALVYQSKGTVDSPELGESEVLPDAYVQAIANFENAVEFAPDKAEYYLWLAVAHHGLNQISRAQTNYELALAVAEGGRPLTAGQQAQAYTGLGWIAYSRDDLEAAEEWFKQAAEADPSMPEANVGLGHIYYNWRQYEAALDRWETAARLDPTNPTIAISQGTLYWRLGTLNEAGEWVGGNPCAMTTISQAEQRQRQWQWEQALAKYEASLALPGQLDRNRAYTYRTMGQVTYLLRDCPDYERLPTLRQTVDLYSEAIELDSNNPLYWHMRGRLRYALWLAFPANTGPTAREPLLAGLADQEQALALDPTEAGDYRPQHWLEITYRNAVEGTLTQGDRAFEAGNYEWARGYYELVALNRPEEARAAFKAGLAALALGDRAAAERWYETGLERASELEDEAAVQEAALALQETTAVADADRSASMTTYFGADWQFVPVTPTAAFDLALAAVTQADYAEAGHYYELGLRLAAEADDWPAAREAATALRDYLLANGSLANGPLANEGVAVTAVYWPLYPAWTADVEPAVADLETPDRYWRFRADFSLRFITEPFKQRPPGNEADYEIIFRQIIADAAQAAALSDGHRPRYEFYRDANIGWLYLQRAEWAYEAGDYAEATVDYGTALERIQPQTRSATNDYISAAFGRALTALVLEEAATARTWFNTGLELAARHDNRQALQVAHTRLQQLLNDYPHLTNLGQPFLERLLEHLNEA
ncbi:MAG: hypothetical protein R6X32_12760 [Chloroflexota bacterium]